MAGRWDFVSYTFLLFLVLINFVLSSELTNMIDEDVLTTKAYVFWPNATIPFYIDSEHFDHEQSISIMSALALFAFKTCLKFAPVMARPEGAEHVLLLENPTGVRKCTIGTEPQSIEEPHRVTLGYDCLKSPEIDMMIMKALGFPFEHNRAVRDLYIEVQPENVEPGFLDLFTRDLRLPLELRAIPYDPNSVMHFGQRDFSKNGHRTIIFKNRSLRQERYGLSPLDLRKIDVVYGPECRTRDRQEKIELCQNYPGVARRKREATDSPKSLRVNPDITPPATLGNTTAKGNHTDDQLVFRETLVKDLGIQNEINELVDQVNKIAGVALQKAKDDKCGNETKQALRQLSGQITKSKMKVADIISDVALYAEELVRESSKNLTEFCATDKNVSDYILRSSCPFFNPDRCPKTYRSTKSGPVKYSTQHRPIYIQSTKPQGTPKKHIYENWLRSGNGTNEPEVSVAEDATTTASEDAAAKDDLRSGNTRLPAHKSIYVPNYRSSNGSNELKKDRKKRDTSKDTVVVKVTTNKAKDTKAEAKYTKAEAKDTKAKAKDTKAEAKVSKVKKHEKKLKSAKRRFESQRFRDSTDKRFPIVEQVLKEKRAWDDDDDQIDYDTDPRIDERREEKETNYDDKQLRDNDNDPRNEEDYKEPKHEAKKSRYEDKDPSYDDNTQRYEDKHTRYERKDPKYEDKGPRYDKEPKDEENEPERDYAEEKPIEKNRFKVRKPHQVGQGTDQKQGGKGTKSRSAENNNQQKRPTDVQRPRVSDEDEDSDMQENDTDSPTYSKKRLVQKQSKQGQKSQKKAPAQSNRSPQGLPRVINLNKKNKEFYEERKWPDGVARYVIKDPGDVDLDDVRRRLDEVKQILKRRTCARLEELTEEQADNYEDYLVLDNSPDYITGRVGGRQIYGVVELLKGGQHRQHAAMMVMAMLGFYFEISRHDRDKYIRVHTRHVRPDKLHHFEKIREDATFPLPYDYKSATHPAWQFWRQIGRTGISTVATFKQMDPDGSIMKSLGQNKQLLSDMDILKINSVYGISCFKKSPSKDRKERKEEVKEEVEEEEKEKTAEEVGNREEEFFDR